MHIGLKKQRSDKAPRIGDNVFIGAGAQILGDIEIEDGIVIDANSVVINSFLEPNITIAGVPARKVGDKGIEEFWSEEKRVQTLELPKELSIIN